jgi:putative transposase
VSRASLDQWIRVWRAGGFDALATPLRQVTPRTPAEVLGLAAALKRENLARTAAQVARVLRASGGWSPSERTLQRHFARLELDTRPDGSPPPTFGRFEAARPNEMWTGDALHGPVIGGRKTYLSVAWNPSAEGAVGRGQPDSCQRGRRAYYFVISAIKGSRNSR